MSQADDIALARMARSSLQRSQSDWEVDHLAAFPELMRRRQGSDYTDDRQGHVPVQYAHPAFPPVPAAKPVGTKGQRLTIKEVATDFNVIAERLHMGIAEIQFVCEHVSEQLDVVYDQQCKILHGLRVGLVRAPAKETVSEPSPPSSSNSTPVYDPRDH